MLDGMLGRMPDEVLHGMLNDRLDDGGHGNDIIRQHGPCGALIFLHRINHSPKGRSGQPQRNIEVVLVGLCCFV